MATYSATAHPQWVEPKTSTWIFAKARKVQYTDGIIKARTEGWAPLQFQANPQPTEMKAGSAVFDTH